MNNEDLNIEKFNPTRAELNMKVERYKSLTINGVDDKTGYALVDTARKDLKQSRVDITKKGKELRDDANKFSRAVIAKEKELVGIIEPLEKELKAKQDEVDLIKAKEERKILLPERQEKLESINLELSDDEILEMDSDTFSEFFNGKKMEYLEAKENERLEEQREKNREQELEDARKEGEARARIEAEHEAERVKAEAKEKEEQAERDRLAKIKQEEEESRKLAKSKEYIKFLQEIGYTEETKNEFVIKETETAYVFYKKISEFKK